MTNVVSRVYVKMETRYLNGR